jgi:hypothetical protein
VLIAIREHLRHPSKSEIPGLMNGMATFKEIYELRNSFVTLGLWCSLDDD